MKYNRASDKQRQQESRLIPGAEWHPLDHSEAPEYIPEQWIGPHVGLRLVEAFKTLARMPHGGGSRKSGVWPQYRHEWVDLMAQMDADKAIKEQDIRNQNRARLMPTAEDVSRMEKLIVWPARYLGSRPRIARVVQRVALYRARDLDIDAVARKMQQPAHVVRRFNRSGLDAIAAGLRREKEPVF